MNFREKWSLSIMLLILGQMLVNISEKTGSHFSYWYLVFFLVAEAVLLWPKKGEK